jgi:mitochondrial fission protein ELM1
MKVIALLDNRAGNNTQVLGVAEKLGLSFEIIRLKYNALARLPSVVLGASGRHLAANTRRQIKHITHPQSMDSSVHPLIVISAGRRAALAARYIKKKIPNAFLCSLMKPDAALDAFDLIALPEHDRVEDKKMIGWEDEQIRKKETAEPQPPSNTQQPTTNNYLYTLTSPHPLTTAILENERKKWLSLFEGKPKPWIAAMVGGTSKHAIFTTGNFMHLAQELAHVRNATGGTLFVTTSRRTSAVGEQCLKQYLFSEDVFFSYAEGQARGLTNPYFGFLACADVLIVTGDSIAMCSEAVYTGKPTYIFSSDKTYTPKFAYFRDQLFKQKLARPFQNPIALDWNALSQQDAALEIASTIRQRLKLL